MRRLITVFLALSMAFGLWSVSFAAGSGAKLSPQKLTVNGRSIECEKYNIDDHNYFKLRDLAKLLSGTSCQFEVGWDEGSQTVTITTGQPYTEVGGELSQRGDLSKTAKPSTQTVRINGKTVSSLSVYNIGDNNFFKLRDLGEALGFSVDYDPDTDTAIISSKDKDMAKTKKLVIRTGDRVMYASFEDNSSAEAFAEKLSTEPVTVDMHDYGSFEKVGPLPYSLPRNDEQITTKPGDIILYQGNQITIYYDQNTWSFTRLAKVPDADRREMLDFLGNGDVTVEFSLEE